MPYTHMCDDRQIVRFDGRVRYLTSGEGTERCGETDTLRNVTDDWTILVAMVPDAGVYHAWRRQETAVCDVRD